EIASGTPALAGGARENKNALATPAPHASAGVTEFTRICAVERFLLLFILGLELQIKHNRT
ncbi:MAG: hypothetical protein Q7T89_16180, partial [Anaerolineales bacterium]|nr:hypothetical protein [Anaerolineales bacterium]